MSNTVEISAIVPVGERYDESGELVREYLEVLECCGKSYELIYVLDGPHASLGSKLVELSKSNDTLRIYQLSKPFGEATALTVGFDYATGSKILTLPSYYQIDSAELVKLTKSFDDCDMAIAVRWPRASASKFEEFRRKVFHWLVHFLAGEKFQDLGCNVRLMKRKIIEEIRLYGDQYRFLPLLVSRSGFHVREVKLNQSTRDRFEGRYAPKFYLQRLLDIFTVFFLTRFTKKPLRFFGMVGSIATVVGGLFLSYLVFERLFFGVGLADRPALLLSSLLVVLGLQLFALGLLGELIIFTHGREMKEYKIEKIVN